MNFFSSNTISADDLDLIPSISHNQHPHTHTTVFDRNHKANGVRLSNDDATMRVTDETHGWHTCRTRQSFTSGKHYVEMIIDNDPTTTNTWRMCIGVIPAEFRCDQKQYTCVGSNQGGWGYVALGKKYSKRSSIDEAYGPTYARGDTIGVELDFTAKTIQFYKNGRGLGIAFRDLGGTVHVACALTAKDAQVTIVRRNANVVSHVVSSNAYDIIHDSKVDETTKIRALERAFGNKFRGNHIDMNSSKWSESLSALVPMGFPRVNALEAILVCSPDEDNQRLGHAVEYLFAASNEQRVKFDAATAAQLSMVKPSGSSASLLLPSSSSQSSIANNASFGVLKSSLVNSMDHTQLEKLRTDLQTETKKLENDKINIDRVIYRSALECAIVDQRITPAAIGKLRDIRRDRNITKETHDVILRELNITTESYSKMIKVGEEVEQLRMKNNEGQAESRLECVLCIEEKPDHVLLDCMHVCFCEGCAAHYLKTNRECPKCRAPITKIRKIFF